MKLVPHKFGIIALIMALSLQIQAQSPDYVRGEIIVQMQPDLVDSGKRLSLRSNLSKSYTIEKNLFPELGIYLLSYDPAKSLDSAMDDLSLEDDILYVQENHKVSKRETTPNDPFFAEQWFHQTIDSELAWDVTTGGPDSEGREIVIAVMDAGFDIDHQDFEGNVWVNEDEIQDDGIDNDNNGYIDDYFGYNFTDLNDDHGDGNSIVHGTTVAAMAAARGDNGQGVAGVTWDAKMMFLSGLRTASEIVEAMSYISDTRQRYNETNGAEGAYVVVSTISLGIRNASAEDFPIWCNLYDELGENGVLNVCAVDNLDSDVDINGDIPTVCTSDFLITVTNTDPNNQIDDGAAFGNTSVDIGAPGTNNFTTFPNNEYGATQGTSVAAPLVAGTVALLYTAPCESIAERSLTDPASTALTMKNLIFEGAKASNSLQGITTQGAVLNVFGSIQALDIDCDSNIQTGDIGNFIRITPNLMSKQDANLTIDYRAQNSQGDPSIMVFDSKGSLILTRGVNETIFGDNRIRLNLTDRLNSGFYYVSLIFPNKEVFTEKLVIF